MAKYRKVDPRIWNDAKFRDLSDQGMLVFLFILTHPHMTSLGAMRASIPGMAAELGWSTEAFAKAFTEGWKAGLIEHDKKASYTGLPNFLRYNGPESPNVIKSWQKSWDMLPECELKTLLPQRLKGFMKGLTKGFREAWSEVEHTFADHPLRNQEQEQEQEQEQDPEQEGKRAPPVDPDSFELDNDPDPEPDLIKLEEQFVTLWNSTPGVLKNRGGRLTAKRREAFRVRLADPDWPGMTDEVRAKFPLQVSSDWKPNMDWILRPDSITKILEGTYAQKWSKTDGQKTVTGAKAYDPDNPVEPI